MYCVTFGSMLVQALICMVLAETEGSSERLFEQTVSTLQRTLAMKTSNFSNIFVFRNILTQLSHSFSNLEFVSWVSHDLRTPLVAFSGFIDLLLAETKPTQAQKDYLLNCTSAIKSMSALITNLLDFSRIEAQQFQLHREVTNLSQEFHNLARSLQIVRNHAQTKTQLSIELDNMLSDDSVLSEKLVWCDFVRLEQIISNLVVNALKYTRSDEKSRINLRVQIIDPNQQQYRLVSRTKSSDFTVLPENGETYLKVNVEVEDNGIGIADEQQQNIFQPFVQISDGSNYKASVSQSGIGLGLYIVSELTRCFGGQISLQSKLGVGSKFIVTGLKLRYATDIEIEREKNKPIVQHTLSKQRVLQQISNKKQLHVLVAEDNKQNQLIFRKFAESCGLKCTFANNGQEVIDEYAANHEQFSMIFMDLQMPVKSGFEAAKEIREFEKERHFTKPISIVALTASPNEKESTAAVGMNDCILKPLNRATLLETVHKYERRE